MKVDFKKLKVQFEIEGELMETDVAKPVGNIIFSQTSDIGLSDFAREIYHKGNVDIPTEYRDQIHVLIERSNLLAPIKRALIEELNKKEE